MQRCLAVVVGVAAAFVPSTNGLTAKEIEFLKAHGSDVGKIKSPLTINGKKYYVIVAHPRQIYRLKVLEARENYKHANHVRRWEKRYGRKYPMVEGEYGSDVAKFDRENPY